MIVDCPTCQGTGEIDETLGGDPYRDPHAICPDCEGSGEMEVSDIDPNRDNGWPL